MTPKSRGGKFVTCTVRGCKNIVDSAAIVDLCSAHLKPIWPENDKVLGESEHTRLVCNRTTHRGIDKRTEASYYVCACDCAAWADHRRKTMKPNTQEA